MRRSCLMFRAKQIYGYIFECWLYEIVCVGVRVCVLFFRIQLVYSAHISNKKRLLLLFLCAFGMLSICSFFSIYFCFYLITHNSEMKNMKFLGYVKKKIIAGSKTYLPCVLFCFVACQCRSKIKTNENKIWFSFVAFCIRLVIGTNNCWPPSC